MPVLDTQVLFALSPKDPKHSSAMKLLESHQDLVATDASVFEFGLVLRARGRKISEIRESLLALSQFFLSRGVREEKTIDIELLVLSSDIESKNMLSYFDSLIAASALVVDGAVVGDDEAFDRVPGLKRIALK